MNNEEPIKAEYNRQPDGKFGPGNMANPAGRPKGQTLKEYQAEQFRQMSPEEKAEWLKDIPKGERWRMSEGNPKQDTDITSKGLPIVQLPQEILDKNEINPSPIDNSEGQA